MVDNHQSMKPRIRLLERDRLLRFTLAEDYSTLEVEMAINAHIQTVILGPVAKLP